MLILAILGSNISLFSSRSYETSDGIAREEQAEVKNIGTDEVALVVRGSYSYTGADGVLYTINFIADENGFQPQGAHIPVAV
jgi:hypothetical protein